MSHRTIHIFLSSTFRDFGEERDLLDNMEEIENRLAAAKKAKFYK